MAADDILWKNVEAMKSAHQSSHNQGPKESNRKPSPPSDNVIVGDKNHNNHSSDEAESSMPTANRVSTSTARADVRTTKTDGTDQANGRTDERTSMSPMSLLDQIPARPAQRRPERYAFQFWADQITRLKKLRQVLNMAKDPDDRTEIALSDLVRTAVDNYLDGETGRTEQPDGAN